MVAHYSSLANFFYFYQRQCGLPFSVFGGIIAINYYTTINANAPNVHPLLVHECESSKIKSRVESRTSIIIQKQKAAKQFRMLNH